MVAGWSAIAFFRSYTGQCASVWKGGYWKSHFILRANSAGLTNGSTPSLTNVGPTGTSLSPCYEGTTQSYESKSQRRSCRRSESIKEPSSTVVPRGHSTHYTSCLGNSFLNLSISSPALTATNSHGFGRGLRLSNLNCGGFSRNIHTSRPLQGSMRNPYEVLGIGRGASKDDIKKKFKEMAKKYHPDLNPSADAKTRMSEITAAYEILSDPHKRQFYDQTGMSMDEAAAGGGASSESSSYDGGSFGSMFNGGDASFMFTDFAEMFSRMSGGGAGAGSPFGSGSNVRTSVRGDDIQTSVSIDFMSAMKGCTRNVSVRRNCTCTECNGSGSAAGTGYSRCKTCSGSGVQRVERGPIVIGLPCKSCGGAGQVISHPCRICQGTGLKTQTKNITLEIPAGIRQGMEIRVVNEGHAGLRGGRPGNLFATVNVHSHPLFSIVENDIHVSVGLSLKTCLLGGVITVPTLEGDVQLTTPPRTTPASIKVLRGKGPPLINQRGNGNLVVQFFLDIPDKLTERQVEAIIEFDKDEQLRNSAKESKKNVTGENKTETMSKKPTTQNTNTVPPPPPPLPAKKAKKNEESSRVIESVTGSVMDSPQTTLKKEVQKRDKKSEDSAIQQTQDTETERDADSVFC